MTQSVPQVWKRFAFATAALAVAVVLGSCSIGSENASAAQAKRVDTFAVTPTSVVLLTDAAPTVDVQESATRYTLQSSGTIAFRLGTGADQSYSLDAGDVVVDRPVSGLITILRSQ